MHCSRLSSTLFFSILRSIQQSAEGIPLAGGGLPRGAARLHIPLGISHRILLSAGGTLQFVEERAEVAVANRAEPSLESCLKSPRVVIAILRKKCQLCPGGVGIANSLAERSSSIIHALARQLDQCRQWTRVGHPWLLADAREARSCEKRRKPTEAFCERSLLGNVLLQERLYSGVEGHGFVERRIRSG